MTDLRLPHMCNPEDRTATRSCRTSALLMRRIRDKTITWRKNPDPNLKRSAPADHRRTPERFHAPQRVQATTRLYASSVRSEAGRSQTQMSRSDPETISTCRSKPHTRRGTMLLSWVLAHLQVFTPFVPRSIPGRSHGARRPDPFRSDHMTPCPDPYRADHMTLRRSDRPVS